MNAEWKAVKQFHEKFGHPVSEHPKSLSEERAQKRYNWMKEKLDEFMYSVKKQDIAEQADAMIDLMYFALGTMVEMGVYPDKLFEIVQRANMSKLWDDGKPHYAPDGKIIKPAHWKDPHEELRKAIEEM